jgi:hypothetical protein
MKSQRSAIGLRLINVPTFEFGKQDFTVLS